MRFSVDPWDPEYGSSLDVDLARSEIDVNLDIEVSARDWAPRAPVDGTTIPDVVFIDGVRRIDARAWVEHEGRFDAAIFASYAAGSVRCAGRAEIVDIDVRRGVFSASPVTETVATGAGAFEAVLATDGSPERLSLALQDAMTGAEVAAAERARRTLGAGALVVVDGPLRGRQHLADTVGLVKTHHVRYLPEERESIVADLAPGERTPVFLLRSSWARLAWYVRLPGPSGSPWAGVVRAEARAELEPAAATALADALTATLPVFASTPHKDSRAPQNLFPIAGLERELRHRLGATTVVYRALRRAAAA